MDPLIHHSICSCTSSEHTVHWQYSPAYKIQSKLIPEEVDFQWPAEVYFDICVSWNQSFFKRCWNAVRYVFGHRSVYGHFDCFTLEKAEARKLVSFLQDYVNEPDEITPVKRECVACNGDQYLQPCPECGKE